MVELTELVLYVASSADPALLNSWNGMIQGALNQLLQ